MTETKTEGPWCSQHKQPRAECRPGDRHVWSLRVSDMLMRKAEAKAASLGLDRNAGVEKALEAWTGGPPAPGSLMAGIRHDEATARARKRPAGRTEPPAPVAAGPDLAATVAQLQRQMDELMAKDEPLARARKRAAVTAPGTVLFREPGAEPVASFPVPEVPARSKRGSR